MPIDPDLMKIVGLSHRELNIVKRGSASPLRHPPSPAKTTHSATFNPPLATGRGKTTHMRH